MEIYILDPELFVAGVVTKYNAVIWKDIFDEPGTFRASFLFTDKLNTILKRGNILYKTDELQAGVISYKDIRLDREGNTVIQVRGRMAGTYLGRRVVWSKMVLSGTSEEVMRRLVEEQAISPKDPDRRMPRLKLGELCGHSDHIEKQVTYSNLQETLTGIASAAGLGYRLRLDLADRIFYFEVYKGIDRTLGTEHPCIFARDYGNVYTQEYYEDDSNFKNVCLVCGSGEDESRITAAVGTAAGLDRYEMAYNASFLGQEGMTETEYRAQLKQKGAEKLAEYYLAQSFESKINQKKAMEYALGDRVTCYDPQWGIRMDTQIKKTEKNLSKDEQETYLTFGDSGRTITALIKASIR